MSASNLKVPLAPSRPGESPNFRLIELSPAGATKRPLCAVAAADIKDLASGLMRVLDDSGSAIEPWDPHLGIAGLRDGLSQKKSQHDDLGSINKRKVY
jgi:2-oxoisovalerate dehydrogenase E1 component alpha subunit